MSEFKYDLHVHTAETSSCAKVNSQTLVQMYKEAGYSGVVITDHYFKDYFDAIDVRHWEDKVSKFLTGYKLAKEEGDRIGLRVILGMEIRFLENKNDYLIYGLDESFLHNYKELYSLGITNFSMLTKDKGILIFQAHPFRRGLVTANLSDIHGIEVYNGSKKHFSNNDKANKFAEANNIKCNTKLLVLQSPGRN